MERRTASTAGFTFFVFVSLCSLWLSGIEIFEDEPSRDRLRDAAAVGKPAGSSLSAMEDFGGGGGLTRRPVGRA